MTALENVNLPLEISRDFIDDEKSIKLLESVGLKNRVSHYPHELSGGEQQRVAIARSLISSPEILIADEPTGNLDKKNSKEVIELLFQLQKNYKSTLILVTHDKSLADLCDEIITLDNGLII
jgi:putative ABC transport system ATP-binding protein